jgi:protein-S-isoprenylcysteine O-methyltransferase Ste14
MGHAGVSLELRIPPDLVALAVGGGMGLVWAVTPSVDVPLMYRIPAAGAMFVAAVVLIVTARVALARSGTTFNPTAPQQSRRLVTSGPYRISRNPMYVGTLLVLFALAALLSNPFSLILSGAFVVYIDRFQIAPEEHILAAKFGREYQAYASRVRRWL